MAVERVRLQAYLARAGVASRRASEELIRAGKVRVNGAVAEIGSSVDPASDRVEVNGEEVTPRRIRWIAMHKPKGYVTTRDDPRGRKTVYDLLPEGLRHLFHVGRLDRDSSGLLLLTNDGDAAHRLLHPRYGTTKEYWVDLASEPEVQELRQLVRGIELEDGLARAESVVFRNQLGPESFRYEIIMREGKRREVRRMFEAIGYPVVRLSRHRFGPIEIGRLAPGDWRYLTPEELGALGASTGSSPARSFRRGRTGRPRRRRRG